MSLSWTHSTSRRSTSDTAKSRKRDDDFSFVGQETSPFSQEFDKPYLLGEHHRQVVPVDDKEIRLFATCNRVSRLVGYAVERYKDAATELGLALNLPTEHEQRSFGQGAFFPLGLNQVGFMVKIE